MSHFWADMIQRSFLYILKRYVYICTPYLLDEDGFGIKKKASRVNPRTASRVLNENQDLKKNR